MKINGTYVHAVVVVTQEEALKHNLELVEEVSITAEDGKSYVAVAIPKGWDLGSLKISPETRDYPAKPKKDDESDEEMPNM